MRKTETKFAKLCENKTRTTSLLKTVTKLTKLLKN